MKNLNKKSLLQNLLLILGALAVFSALYYPSLSGKDMVSMHDAFGSAGIRGEKQKFGDNIIWTNSIFSGVPFHTGLAGKHVKPIIPRYSQVLPFSKLNPIFASFTLFIFMFIFLRVLKINPYLSCIISVVYSLFGFNLLSIEAGHVNKIFTMAFVPGFLAGAILILDKKYISGILLFIYSLGMFMAHWHVQIIYYSLIFFLIYMLIHFVFVLRDRTFKLHLKPYLLILTLSIIVGFAYSQTNLINYFYSKDTIRGGSELSSKNSSGLSKDYAYSWSLGKMETFSFIFPYMYGGSSTESLSENSEMYETMMRNKVPKKTAKKVIRQIPLYWGEVPFTSVANYMGVFTFFFFIFGAFYIKDRIRIWLFSSLVLFLFLSWGKHFAFFSDLFREYIPFYNKFRSVSMSIFVVGIVLLVFAGLGLEKIFRKEAQETLIKNLKYTLYVSLGLGFLGLIVFPFALDFSSQSDGNFLKNFGPLASQIESALKSDRIAFLRKDAFKFLVLITLLFFASKFYIQKTLSQKLFIAILVIIPLGDMFVYAKNYITESDFSTPKIRSERYKQKRPVDESILKDNGHYRVLDLTKNIFNDNSISYFHKSIGGYSATKLSRYQDLIENGISSNIQQLGQSINNKNYDFDNISILNMLNAKYFIVGDSENSYLPNHHALGNIWHVQKTIKVNNADEEIAALQTLDVKNALVYDKRFAKHLSQKEYAIDSTSYAKLNQYYPDTMQYEVFSKHKQLLVFSEIYFNRYNEWEAYIDGEKASHFRANYALRAMEVPAGKHQLTFIFNPWYVNFSYMLCTIFSILSALIFFGVMIYWGYQNFVRKKF